ncbi:glutathione S-transferase family protein [Pseudomonas baetica]|uniref:glutathione S-transferase family protein n=1 Tax=Pseudomonas baetica TaxID=674054 RepID=UPI00240667F5|nr:glutathione binding-like protein [Pseudomonas baetica]MDF9779012.1 RNA polymerase-associated protein [Pseudomonas baetica]
MSAFHILTIFTQTNCVRSHIVRFLATEKDVACRAVDIASKANLLTLADVTTAPAITSREVSLSDFDVIVDYLDERYPLPAMLPPDAINRAMYRNQVRAFHKELFPLLPRAIAGDKDARQQLAVELRALDTAVTGQAFFGGETFTLADVTLAPWLYAAKAGGVALKNFPALSAYAERMFARDGFTSSLTEGLQTEAA